jgi:polysaccharide deacetylase family protein (PEP-CTERM system associated)
MPHILTVDVEDWFHTQAMTGAMSTGDWENYPIRIHHNLSRLLKLFRNHRVRATFFVLGWVAERYPELVEEILHSGHEVASHGYAHRLIYQQTPQEFEEDVAKSLEILERITGHKITGYRAPSFSIKSGNGWIFAKLKEMGIQYDSSIFPIWHDLYGIPTAPRFPFPIRVSEEQVLWEFPLSTVKILGKNIPLAGGGYLRLFPYWFTRRGLKSLQAQNKMGIVYIHPWELDLEQPRPELNRLSRFRQYTNIRTMHQKLERLLSEFEFISMGEAYLKLACSKT